MNIELNEDEINTLVDFINYFVYDEHIFLNEDPDLSNLLNKLEYANQKRNQKKMIEIFLSRFFVPLFKYRKLLSGTLKYGTISPWFKCF